MANVWVLAFMTAMIGVLVAFIIATLREGLQEQHAAPPEAMAGDENGAVPQQSPSYSSVPDTADDVSDTFRRLQSGRLRCGRLRCVGCYQYANSLPKYMSTVALSQRTTLALRREIRDSRRSCDVPSPPPSVRDVLGSVSAQHLHETQVRYGSE